MARSGKTGHICTTAESTFRLCMNVTHALLRNTMHVLEHRWPSLLLWMAFQLFTCS